MPGGHGKSASAAVTANPQPAVEQIAWNRPANVGGKRSPGASDNSLTTPRGEVNRESTDWKRKTQEEIEKRLRDKAEQLRILQVNFSSPPRTTNSVFAALELCHKL